MEADAVDRDRARGGWMSAGKNDGHRLGTTALAVLEDRALLLTVVGLLADGLIGHGVVALDRCIVVRRDVHLVDGERVILAA